MHVEATRIQLARQVGHWTQAIRQLEDLSRIAAPGAWRSLEQYLGVAVETMLRSSVDRLRRHGAVLQAELAACETPDEFTRLHREVVAFRRRYIDTETILDFYGDAINTRTNDRLSTYLRACDVLAARSMRAPLQQLGIPTPSVLTYVDKGLGASILKAGLRLWDGRSVSAVAAIKIVRHSLHRPTALLHEAGHQVAHLVGWAPELSAALREALSASNELASTWSSWASEIAADAFAFATVGYGAVGTLHDVLAGEPEAVFRRAPFDPHPSGWLRVLLGREMCSAFYGKGPWDALARAWTTAYPLEATDRANAEFCRASQEAMRRVVQVIFERPYRAFGGRPLSALVDPHNVGPEALEDLKRSAGQALFVSNHWVESECLRLLAICSYRAATEPEHAAEIHKTQEGWMLRLGSIHRVE